MNYLETFTLEELLGNLQEIFNKDQLSENDSICMLSEHDSSSEEDSSSNIETNSDLEINLLEAYTTFFWKKLFTL